MFKAKHVLIFVFGNEKDITFAFSNLVNFIAQSQSNANSWTIEVAKKTRERESLNWPIPLQQTTLTI